MLIEDTRMCLYMLYVLDTQFIQKRKKKKEKSKKRGEQDSYF